MKIRPLAGQALIQLEREDKSPSGLLHIPETISKTGPGQSVTARVVRIGAWRQNAKGLAEVPEVHVGDRILLNQHVGQEVENGSARMRLVDLGEILAVMGTE